MYFKNEVQYFFVIGVIVYLLKFHLYAVAGLPGDWNYGWVRYEITLNLLASTLVLADLAAPFG